MRINEYYYYYFKNSAVIVQKIGLLTFNTISHSCSAFKLSFKLNYITTVLLHYTVQFPATQNSNDIEMFLTRVLLFILFYNERLHFLSVK